MSVTSDLFYNNCLYQLLTKNSVYTEDLLQELNSILHEQPELARLCHPIEGSYFHVICRNSNEQENVSHRMIYALSNAGANPNFTNEKGNTPLHEVLIRGFANIGLDLVQALFRVGVDQRILNKQEKAAYTYLEDQSQLIALYDGYGQGIWTAIETNNIQETERLMKGFIKVNCKHENNETLLDKARAGKCTDIVRILADYQVTIEFVHSILACDWDRVSLIHQYEGQFIKMNISDSLHTLTWVRTGNRTYSKPILEFCLDTKSLAPFETIFNSSILKSKIDVNVFCTNGLPFFFHMFAKCISSDIQQSIFSNANFNLKSSKGETFLVRLIHLYDEYENKEYLNVFDQILNKQPLLLSQRDEHGRTVVDHIELTSSLSYHKLSIFYEKIKEILMNQIKNDTIIERFILNSFGYHLLLFFNDENAPLTRSANDLLRSLKLRQGLPALMFNLSQAIEENDLVKIQSIFKTKSNIYFAKDWSGRTCAHLAVLYQRRQILAFLYEKCHTVLDLTDNLDRTPLHYACIMNDEATIAILEKASAKQTIDCFNLFPNDYKTKRSLCCEEFYAQDFPKKELEKCVPGLSDYLKLSFYFPLKKSIEENSIESIKLINSEINTMGFYLEDFNPNSYANDWLKGERYIPLLFVALELRSISLIQCLMELGLPLTGRMYISKAVNMKNSRCVSFRTLAEELECFDIIEMMNDLEDDSELKTLFKSHLSSAETNRRQPSINSEQQLKRKKMPAHVSNVNKQNIKDNSHRSETCILL
ncbi:unnamed protein product [Rotaria socialis]|uniref:Uncharacterized protein n=1 Tax=Rotaria socialis TaxID=392032 RepID=A0A818QY07_9BILA|nr:unnamed protein product [Rotaria socialis]CAF4576633.1 unnamed protein product [Rotaria socialis]